MSHDDTGRTAWRAPANLAVAVVLCVVAAALRAGALGPSSLWLDDAWVALVSKTSDVSQTFMVGLTGPGFAFMLKGWLALVGFSEVAAQLPAFAFGLAAPGLLYLVAVARGFSVAGALAAGGLLLASPVHIVYSTRVKHYTLDVLLAIVLVALAWRVLQSPAARRQWVWLAATAALAVAMSGGVAPVAVAALGASLLASLGRGREDATVAAAACAAWAVFAAGWYVLVLHPAITPAIRGYWADRYVGSLGELAAGLAALVEGFSALPAPVTVVVLLGGLAALVTSRPLVAVLVAGAVAGLTVLALLGAAPLGGGRTDAVLYPALAIAAGALVDRVARERGAVGAGVAAVVVAAAVATVVPTPPYPREDVRPLVAEVEQRRGSGEPLLVYPSTVWAYALYSDGPVELVRSDNPWGFAPRVNDAGVILLEANRDAPERYAAQVTAAVGDAQAVWLLSSHHRADLDVIRQALRGLGLTPDQRWHADGSALTSWQRR